jgi:hypothetical protein
MSLSSGHFCPEHHQNQILLHMKNQEIERKKEGKVMKVLFETHK